MQKNTSRDPSEDKKGPSQKNKAKARRNVDWRWTGFAIASTFVLTILLSWLSTLALDNAGYFVAFLVLLLFIGLGIIFDMLGMAVTSADESPFHSMSARKVDGAREAVQLIRNAERVSSFCNDIIGDISGIITGTATAIVATRISSGFSLDNLFTQLLLAALAAALTIGGKAIGKGIAINNDWAIVFTAGKIVHLFNTLTGRGKNK